MTAILVEAMSGSAKEIPVIAVAVAVTAVVAAGAVIVGSSLLTVIVTVPKPVPGVGD